jgi:transposase
MVIMPLEVIKIRNLDEREKALNMYFQEGKTCKYIAHELKISVFTVTTWCRRYRIKNGIPSREKTGLRKEPINRETLHERTRKDETTPEARISKLEMEVDLLRNFLILREGE